MKQYTDQCFRDLPHLQEMLRNEHLFQLKKWGVQTRTLFEWLAYLTEEVGELAEAISCFEYNNAPPERIREEAIQVATLSLKIAEMMEG